MGIKDLWTILTPFCERKPLFELQGKTVAVDLSCWICEAQNVSDYSVQPRMYLRNLYFRTCFLLLMDVQPVFVLEGKAPTLKYQTIANRNEIQFKGAKPKSDKIKTGKDRTRFHFVLKQCEEMLKFMGLACITGSGEAESMCAYLNEDNLVAGCISQDSDCFAYGARVVFRNFSISHQGSYAASGGAVDIYDIEKANEALSFGRNKIIALALLCGSDYNDGVHGIGKDSALKFMDKYEDTEILDRMRSWRSNKSIFLEMENKISDKNICVSCGHLGKVQGHTKSGCAQCKTNKGCDFTKFREKRLEIKNELQIRTKALLDPEFPNETLINEYLVKKDNVKQLDLTWRQPNLINFVKFTTKYLGWEELYAFEKLLPILTRWQLKNHKLVFDKIKRKSISEIKGIIFPKHIKKLRNPKGVPSYEIIWEDKEKYFEDLIPLEQLEEYLENKKDDFESLWSTIEPKYLVDAAYPNLVEEYLEKKGKKTKKPTKRQKTKPNSEEINEISDQLLNTSISEPKIKKSRGRPKKTKEPDPTLKTIDNYLIKRKDSSVETIDLAKTTELANTADFLAKTKVEQLKQQTIDEHDLSFDLNASKFGDEDLDLDLSAIIDNIVSRSPKLPEKIKKLGYKMHFEENCFYSQNIEDIFEETETEAQENLNQSCFFQMNYDKVDLFEKTFDKNNFSDTESENSDTELVKTTSTDCNLKKTEKFLSGNLEDAEVQTSFEKNKFSKTENIDFNSGDNNTPDLENFCNLPEKSMTVEENNENLDNTFDENYVPLFDRIKKNSRI